MTSLRSSDSFTKPSFLTFCFHVYISLQLYFTAFASSKSFHRESLKIYLIFTEKTSRWQGTMQTKICGKWDKTKKVKRWCKLSSSPADRQIKQPSKPNHWKKNMLSLCSIWLCPLRPQSSKPWQKVTLAALLPSCFIKPPWVYLPSAGITFSTHFSLWFIWENLSCVSLAQPQYALTYVCM